MLASEKGIVKTKLCHMGFVIWRYVEGRCLVEYRHNPLPAAICIQPVDNGVTVSPQLPPHSSTLFSAPSLFLLSFSLYCIGPKQIWW